MTDSFYNPPGTVMLPMAELVDGAWYEGICRNATAARWSAADQRFHYLRYKWGDIGSPSQVPHLGDPTLSRSSDGFAPHRRMAPWEAEAREQHWRENDAKIAAERERLAMDDVEDD